VIPDDAAKVSADLLEAAQLLHDLPDDADKERFQRRLLSVASAAKHDLARARARLARLLDELRRRS
jgi:hypothetical protein